MGVIPRDSLAQAIRDELAHLGEAVVARDLELALGPMITWRNTPGARRRPQEASADTYEKPRWIEMPYDDAGLSAPDIFAPASSAKVPTGLWRTMRPVIDYTPL